MAKKNKKMNIQYSSYLKDIISINDSFDGGVMMVAYHGQNRNGSKISKANFEKNIETLAYVPVVANYSIEADSIGSHDSKAVKNNGKTKKYNITMPLGVVPQNFKWYWETVDEDDGSVHEYLCTDILLWKRQPVYEHIKAEKIIDQSMEISVSSGKFDEDGYYDIEEFNFTALCLLESAEPCFESASLHTYSDINTKQDLSDMYEELKVLYSYQPTKLEDIDKKAEKEEYGLDKLELIKEFGFEVDSLGFDIETIEYEELKEKLEAMSKANDDNSSKGADEGSFELNGNISQSLNDAVAKEVVDGEYGSYRKYFVIDYDIEASEVYVLDIEDWKIYGFKYTMSGDDAVLDMESKKRKKYVLVDYVEGVKEEFSIKDAVDFAVSMSVDREKELIRKEYEASISELEEYKSYKEKADAYEKAELDAAKDLVVKSDDYAIIADSEEFKNIVKDVDKYSVSDLEKELDLCLAKYAKESKAFAVKTQKEEKPVGGKVGVASARTEEKKPYGNLFDNINKKKTTE